MSQQQPLFQETDPVCRRVNRTVHGVVMEVITSGRHGEFRYRVVWPGDQMRETEEAEADLLPLPGRGSRHITNVFSGNVTGKVTQVGRIDFNDR